MSLFSFLAYQLQHNQLAAAAVIGAPAAAIGYSVRNFPGFLGSKLKRRIFIDVRLNSDQHIYREALEFITQNVIRERFTHSYVFSTRTHLVKSLEKMSFNNRPRELVNMWRDVTKRRSIEVGYGRHIGFYKRHILLIDRHLEQDDKSGTFKESLTCSFITHSSDIIQQFKDGIDEFARIQNENERGVQIAINESSGWVMSGRLRFRSIDTIFLPNNVTARTLAHIKEFEDHKEWNHSKGLPNHTGILLHGGAGNGKSSLLHAIASETKRKIYYLNLGSVKDDSTWSQLLTNEIDWNNIILSVEDIDATGANIHRRHDGPLEVGQGYKQSVSLSTILNSLDGITSPDGLIVIATTNHIEHLDPALLRPGRFDLVIEINDLGRAEFESMARLFDMDPSKYILPYFSPMSGATMRALLLKGGVPAVEEYQKTVEEDKS